MYVCNVCFYVSIGERWSSVIAVSECDPNQSIFVYDRRNVIIKFPVYSCWLTKSILTFVWLYRIKPSCADNTEFSLIDTSLLIVPSSVFVLHVCSIF